jgi:hypothetical protein
VQHAVAIVEMAHGELVQDRIEQERLLATTGRRRRALIDTVRGREHVPALAGSRLCIGIRRWSAGTHRLRRRLWRQIEAAFTAAASQRQSRSGQNENGPSRGRRAGRTSHSEIPKCGRTIQRLLRSGETPKSIEFSHAKPAQPNFRSFSSRLSQAFACDVTFFGAVPP